MYERQSSVKDGLLPVFVLYLAHVPEYASGLLFQEPVTEISEFPTKERGGSHSLARKDRLPLFFQEPDFHDSSDH